jgi:hypothetical protein
MIRSTSAVSSSRVSARGGIGGTIARFTYAFA